MRTTILIAASILALATACSALTGTPTPRPTYTPSPTAWIITHTPVPLIPMGTTSVLPTPTIGPVPADILPTKRARTPTPDPTQIPFTKRETSTPAPRPEVKVSRPFPTAIPTPAPTPTPIPLNIHDRTVYQYSYSMGFPPGWTSEQESDGYTTFLSARGTAGAAIHIWIINSDDVTNLPRERNDELLERIRTAAGKGDSAIFKMKPNRPPPADVKEQLWQAWQMEYRWRESPDECIRDVIDIISPSNWYTHGVLISTWICEKDLDERAKNERQKMLTSFREKAAAPGHTR